MFEEYKKEVLNYYKQKKAAGGLSLNLLYPTRAKLRNECIEVIKSRYLKKDRNTIEASFGEMSELTAYLMRIKKKGAEKLKTFDNFLKDHEIDTDIKNIELLAWLIDFEPRPYKVGQVYNTSLADKPEITQPEMPDEPLPVENEQKSAPAPNNDGQSPLPVPQVTTAYKVPTKDRRFIVLMQLTIAVVALALIASGTYYVYTKNKSTTYPPVTGTEKCMVWAEDHYQPVSCALKFNGQQVVAFDSAQVKGFKKIMRTDTVTRNSIDKLWYFKTGGRLELFTAPGFHPVHTDRKLKRLTEHMLFTYVHHD
jgi:hypothetical protein